VCVCVCVVILSSNTKFFLPVFIHLTTTTGKFSVRARISVHNAPVVSSAIHPCGDYLITCAENCTWAFNNLATSSCLRIVHEEKLQNAKFTALGVHPDGLLLGIGVSTNHTGSFYIYDVKDQKLVANCAHEHPVTSVAFSPNGYYLATADVEGYTRMWDLRKLARGSFHTIDPHSSSDPCVNEVVFDGSGRYLGIADSVVRVYQVKKNVINTLSAHTSSVTGLRFGPAVSFLASTSMDRTLKFYGASQ